MIVVAATVMIAKTKNILITVLELLGDNQSPRLFLAAVDELKPSILFEIPLELFFKGAFMSQMS